MATLTEIRDGLATNLATITGLRTSATVPDNINPPVAIVEPMSISFDTSFNRGLDEYSFKITVIAGRADERSGQNKIDGYCSPTGSPYVFHHCLMFLQIIFLCVFSCICPVLSCGFLYAFS